MTIETATSFLELGRFTMPDGRLSKFKIECDILTGEDWRTLAAMAVDTLPPFGNVEGVPEGGLAFAEALKPYATEGVLLIADDVWVTGKSMEAHRAGREAHCVVAFARGFTPSWVASVFMLNPRCEEAAYDSE